MEQIKDADILMTSFCGVTRAMLEAGKNLKLVFMMRSGWENCNVKAAKELGIPVCNCPSRLAEPGRRSDGRDDDLRVPRHPARQPRHSQR